MLPPPTFRMSKVSRFSFVCTLATFAACASTPATNLSAGPNAPAASGLPPLAGVSTPTPIASAIPFVSLEGPLWVPSEGGYLLFSDVVEGNGAAAKIYKYTPAAQQFAVLPYPAPVPVSTNGLAMDSHGFLLACERYNARVVRLEGPQKLVVLADRWPSDKKVPAAPPLAAPNDLAVRPDGNIYFSDSDWGAREGVAHAPMGVYRIDPAGTLSRILDIEKPNGVALSPDGAFLYIGSDVQSKVWRMPLDAQGSPGIPSLFIDGATVPGGFKVPDGICIDDSGDLYVTNNDDAISAILVFDSAGHPKARIPFPQRPSNCTFGGNDRKTLFVTTLHAIYQVQMPVSGLP